MVRTPRSPIFTMNEGSLSRRRINPASSTVSLRSRNSEALKVAEKLQGGGHPNACGATLPRSVQNIPDAITYLRQVLNPSPPKGSPLNSLESLFDAIELAKK